MHRGALASDTDISSANEASYGSFTCDFYLSDLTAMKGNLVAVALDIYSPLFETDKYVV